MNKRTLLASLIATSLASTVLLSTGLFSNLAQAAISPESLQDIKAVQFNSDTVITAGLPSKAEFEKLASAGVEVVINLIPDGNPNGHANEASLVTSLGMQYEHVSVNWTQPKITDIERFFDIMDANKGKDILVHCAANYRASAFYYLYQIKQGAEDSLAYKQQTLAPWGDLEQSLQEYPQWNTLIETVKAKYQH
ncbi:protein tyrosine phosphatase family protein [Shewanella benthica]|uniref:protein tyrosine phosphatase family protein n=1 Tax=Shewanella benthica TaxID=43661 RepID=UPI00187911C1|nr:protein tyrosine phosphatase family protein [Shewanella benthica]MBE7215480.1 protein tyrosine phosphatase family protein [Shewanella benthica]MCL1062390.1 protein tyrosine phosphatase family protein [Shewanella benthica]